MRRSWPTIVVAAGITLATTVPVVATALPASGQSLVTPEVRVNQVGYPWYAPQAAFVMLARPVRAVRFEVTSHDAVVYQGTSTDDVGSWNSAYRAVYQLSFSEVGTPGVYQVKVLSPAAASFPRLRDR
jgi:Cellulase N-terminal ig-like domain